MNIAYCGINCESCKLYKATIRNDENLRREIANEWGQLYNKTLNLIDLKCLGCRSKIVYEACDKCDIKSCNQKRGIEKCNSCDTYPTCERIKRFKDWQEENNTEVEIQLEHTMWY